LKTLAGKTIWGKAAGAVGVVANASKGAVVGVVNGAQQALQDDGKGFKEAFVKTYHEEVDLDAAMTKAAEFGDERVAPVMTERVAPLAKKAVRLVASVAATAVTEAALGISKS